MFYRNRAATTGLPDKPARPTARGLVAELLLWSLGIFALHAQPRLVSPPTDWQFTPLKEAVHTTPRWSLSTDGKARLVYELLLTNALMRSGVLFRRNMYCQPQALLPGNDFALTSSWLAKTAATPRHAEQRLPPDFSCMAARSELTVTAA